MVVCGMRNSPLVRTALFRHFKRSEISLRWIPEQNQCFSYVSSFCQAKEGEHQRSTPPQEPPIGRAASIRTCPASRKPERPIDDRNGADIYIDVTRPFLTYDWIFKMISPKTGMVLGT